MSEKSPAIRLTDAWKWWDTGGRRVEALRGVDLEVRFGERLAVVGPSGSGKSTLLHVLGALLPLDRGRVEYDAGLYGAAAPRRRRLRQSIGFVFQDAKLIPGLSVQENVCVPLVHRGVWPRAQRAMAGEMLERVGLAHRAAHRPHELSAGELIRAALARALVFRPRILLADEPTGNLDAATGDSVAELMFGSVGPHSALVVVTHNLELAGRAERTVRVRAGSVDA